MSDQNSYQLRIGEILVMKGWITWEQLEEAIQIQEQIENQSLAEASLLPVVSSGKNRGLSVGEILLKEKRIDWYQLTKALKVQKQTKKMLGEILLEQGAITNHDLYRALAAQFKKSFVDFSKVTIPSGALKILSKQIAYECEAIPLIKQDKILLVASAHSESSPQTKRLKMILKDYEVHTAMAPPEEIKKALLHYYGRP